MAMQLQTLSIISKYMPNFWTRDPEMMAVALMSDASGSKNRIPPNTAPVFRLGQSVLLVELIEQLRVIRESKDMRLVCLFHLKYTYSNSLTLTYDVDGSCG